MAYVFVPADKFTIPVQPDGERYPFVVTSEDGSAVFSDSVTDIIGYVIGNGYLSMTAEEQLIARQKFAVATVAKMRLTSEEEPVLGVSPDLGEVMDAGIDDEDLLGYYMEGIDYSAELVSGEIFGANEQNPGYSRVFFRGLDDDREWDYDFPLVVVATDYEPHKPVPVPTGFVTVIDPTNDRTLLNSLYEINRTLVEVKGEDCVRPFNVAELPGA